MMVWRIGLMLWLACAAFTTQAATYYVASDGKAENDGSRAKPWPSVAVALDKAGGGHTILVKPGLYRGPIQIARGYAGTEARPTVIRSEIKWKAVIVGAEYHVISTGDGCDWVTIDGFEVMGGYYDGIKLNGDHNVVRNCWVHNNHEMGIAMHHRKSGIIESNLIEFNGSHIQFHHGVYADGEGLTVRGNILRHNAGFGLHLYPTIRNSRIENNLVHGQVRGRGIIVACPNGGGRNVIVNNTIVEDQPLSIWNGNGEVVVNNILVGAREGEVFSFDQGTTNVLADYNLCLPQSTRQGTHGVTGEPKFVEAEKGAYWLREGSPAIGRGTPQYAPSVDFWGRPRPREGKPDLGAFAFESTLTRAQARADWEYGWPYHRHSTYGSRSGLPDLWAPPAATPASPSK